jgi:hypothetical protein
MCGALLALENEMIEEYLENADPEAIVFDGLDLAIVGFDHNGLMVYDHQKMVNIFIADGMTEDEAIEWIDYNVIGTMGGQGFTILYK